jgi:2',3'-cyclic-nucleotide 2'-phosphodiesterase (5'-nucleotidase family)
MIDLMRKEYRHVLLLDCGDAFDPSANFPRLRAETIFHAMERMGYDAMNVADGELSLGMPFFDRLSNKSTMALLSATFAYRDAKDRVYRPYIIKKIGKMRIGIIGLTAAGFLPVSLKDGMSGRVIQPVDARSALRQVLPAVRRKSDIVILLSHLGVAGTKALLQEKLGHGIDIAIVGHDWAIQQKPIRIGNTIVVENSMNGEYLGKLVLTTGKKGAIKDFSGELIGLGKHVKVGGWAKKMMDQFDHKRIALRSKQRREEAHQIKIKDEGALLKLPPAEAIKKLKEMEKERKAAANR